MRLPRFSLTQLLVGVAVLGIACAFTIAWIRRNWECATAAQTLRAAGVSFELAGHADSLESWSKGLQSVTVKEGQLNTFLEIANSYPAAFDRVTRIVIHHNTAWPPEGVAAIAVVAPNTRSLSIGSTTLSGDEVKGLGAFANLAQLEFLTSTTASFELEELINVEQVQDFKAPTFVGDANMAHIDEVLPNLEILDLSYSRIGDTSLSHVARCKKLRILLLQGTDVTDNAFSWLDKMKCLEQVILYDTNTTSEAVRIFQRDHASVTLVR